MRVLVVSAHPDDEILGVGGTVAGHADRGDEVMLAVMCEGITARYTEERRAIVERQTRQAAEILGAQRIHVGDLADQRLDTMPVSEVAAHVERLIGEFEPARVYTHFGGDVNRDHQVLAEAVQIATRPYSAPSVREVLMFETPSSTEWGCRQLWPGFHPSVFVDISTALERKIEAFCCYEAEVRAAPHPRSPAALADRARFWGSQVNCAAAEPFEAVRILR